FMYPSPTGLPTKPTPATAQWLIKQLQDVIRHSAHTLESGFRTQYTRRTQSYRFPVPTGILVPELYTVSLTSTQASIRRERLCMDRSRVLHNDAAEHTLM